MRETGEEGTIGGLVGVILRVWEEGGDRNLPKSDEGSEVEKAGIGSVSFSFKAVGGQRKEF